MELSNDINPYFGNDGFDREIAFMSWLKHNNLTYVIESRISGGHYIRVIFPGGRYIRVSDFENPMMWYVRDTGEVGYLDIFSLVDRILKYKEVHNGQTADKSN